MKRAAVFFAACLALSIGAAEDEPPPIGVRAIGEGELTGIEAIFPGRILSVTAPLDRDGRRIPLVLIDPEDDPGGPRRIFTASEKDGMVELARGLPPAVNALGALDLGGGPAEEVIAAEPGRLYNLGSVRRAGRPLAPPEPLFERPGIDLRLPGRELFRPAFAADRPLALSRLGEFFLLESDGEGGLRERIRVELPIAASRRSWGLELRSPQSTELEDLGLYLAGPEEAGPARLRTLVIDPKTGRGQEAFSRLPGREAVAGSWYVDLDGRPTLVAATLDAEKVGIFEKQRLRFFHLATGDRSRSGHRPSFELETASRRWQPLGLHVGDVDGDGHDDLILIQPQGLGGGDLLVDVYNGRGTGRFDGRPRRVELDDVDTERWLYGLGRDTLDLDEDGFGELVTLDGEGVLSVFAGQRDRRGRIVERRPRWKLELGEPFGRGAPPAAIDLENDGGPSELVVIAGGDRGRLAIAAFGKGAP